MWTVQNGLVAFDHGQNVVEEKLVVSNQPRAAAVPVKRDLEKEEGEGAPLVDQDD